MFFVLALLASSTVVDAQFRVCGQYCGILVAFQSLVVYVLHQKYGLFREFHHETG